MDIANSFKNIGHLFDCKNRHSFEHEPNTSAYTKPKTCQFEILETFSPAWFAVRIIRSRESRSNEDWNDQYSAESFQQFNKQFNEFYAKDFEPVQSPFEINNNELYVFRNGDEFFRCRIVAGK